MEYTVAGIVLSKQQARGVKTKFGLKQVTDFEVKTTDGAKKCAYWGVFETDMVNQAVSFNATYDQKYDQFTVKGKIMLTGGTVSTPAPAVAPPALQTAASTMIPPAPIAAPEQAPAPQTLPSAPVQTQSNREDHRTEAEEAVFKNLQSAQVLAERFGSKTSRLEVLVPIADMVGRTQTAITLDLKKKGY